MKTYSAPSLFKVREAVSCPHCASDSSKKYLVCEGFFFVKCLKCGMIYQNQIPALEELKEHYGKEYTQYEIDNEQNFFNLMLLGLKDSYFEQWEDTLPDRSILDIGCATGALLAFFNKKGYRTVGIELDTVSAREAKKRHNIDVLAMPLEECLLEGESFGLVHSSHVIEHLRSPLLMISEAYRILKKGGYFAITTPNVKGFQAQYFKQQWRSAINDHLVLYSKKKLVEALTKEGFTIESVKTWGGWAFGAKPAFIKKFLDQSAKIFGFGDVVMVVAKK